MSDELFVDGILGIGFGKGAVRIDFFALAADAVDAKGQPAKERRQRLVMTTEGFVESFAMLSGVMEKLEAQGLVARRPAKAVPDKPREAAGDSPSPNF